MGRPFSARRHRVFGSRPVADLFLRQVLSFDRRYAVGSFWTEGWKPQHEKPPRRRCSSLAHR